MNCTMHRSRRPRSIRWSAATRPIATLSSCTDGNPNDAPHGDVFTTGTPSARTAGPK